MIFRPLRVDNAYSRNLHTQTEIIPKYQPLFTNTFLLQTSAQISYKIPAVDSSNVLVVFLVLVLICWFPSSHFTLLYNY